MSKARLHLVTATAVAGAAIFMLVSGGSGVPELPGWTVLHATLAHPSLVASMRSERPVPCTIRLERLDGGVR